MCWSINKNDHITHKVYHIIIKYKNQIVILYQQDINLKVY